MPIRIPLPLLACTLFAACGATYAQAPTPASANCTYDRSALLALSEDKFDQDMAGGWRTLAATPGCDLVAADLLRDYRQAHANEAGIMYWHEGQLRASAGQYAQAIPLLDHARRPPGDRNGWNPYVDATIAFLRRDKPALERARQALAAVPPPVGANVPEVKDGYMEIDLVGGEKRKVRWPLNIDVVEGLLKCFDKPYKEAYGEVGCRTGSK